MSALFGALSLRGAPLPSELLGRMRAKLTRRQADAHLELALPNGAIAVASRDGTAHTAQDPRAGLACAFDGRLDYPAALVAKLGLAPDRSRNDAALILAAYARYGADSWPLLEGDFVLALWDGRRHALHLVRDVIGVKALYYAQTRQFFVFAAQPGPLFALGGLERRASALRVAAYLARAFPDAESSFFQGVSRLAPAHTGALQSGRFVTRRYYELPRALCSPRSSSEHAEHLREVFLAAVGERLRGRDTLGCLLSGGLDSSGILGALRLLAPERTLQSLSARFRSLPELDEGDWLALLERPADPPRLEGEADRLSPLGTLDRLHDWLDEPFHAPNLFIYDRLAALAADHGLHVLFDGLDGDTVVDHGFTLLSELLARGKWRRLGRELGGLRARLDRGHGSLLWDYAISPLLEPLRTHKAALPGIRFGLLHPEFARQSGFLELARARAAAEPLRAAAMREQHYRALTAPLLPFLLEAHGKLASAYELSPRHPFLDRRVVELCLALPAEQRLHDGWDRVVQRRAFAGLVPAAIAQRQSKSEWSRNFQRQFLVHDRSLLLDFCREAAKSMAGIIDVARLRRAALTPPAASSSEAVLDLWCAVTVSRWLNTAGLSL